MKLIFRATTPQDSPKLSSFLARSFSVNEQSEFLRPELLHWKFWAPREDYRDPRSYVLERDGEIVAHAGIWPMTVTTVTGTISGCHAIDWASDSSVPGAGVAIKRRISSLFDFVYAIAYSDIAAKVLPKMGFREIGEAWSGARPLRPLRQALSRQHLDWKAPARLARNTIWSLLPWSLSSEGWAIKEGVSKTDASEGRRGALLCASRSNSFFRYLQKCPTAKIMLFQIQKNSQDVGRIALSLLHNQTRIVGVWLEQPSAENLSVAYRLAQRAARQQSSSVEIVARGSTLLSEQAAVCAGLKVRRRHPIYVLSEGGKFPSVPFEFQIGDTDDVFLSQGVASYWT
jgi:hypothetical protein